MLRRNTVKLCDCVSEIPQGPRVGRARSLPAASHSIEFRGARRESDKMSSRAWVTLATNDSYSLGALVLAHSLRRVNSAYPAVILVTPAVTDAMRDRLQAVFSAVVTVDVLDSRDAAHLALLQRPELGITFTKIHCWNLTHYEKCVFLDADALIVQNCDELFEREELSAAPDVGWPDCFNSGVFVYRPSKETFDALIKFAKERGSFDGGDQGLLNSFFSDWARGDINKHLPFLYNVTSAAFYSYIPALKHYGQDLKIIHFIGASKPWLHTYNWESQTVDAADHLKDTLQLWWNIFVSSVHTQLDTSMENASPELPPSDVTQALYYEPVVDQNSEFPWHQNHRHESQELECERQTEPCFDPWDLYGGNIPPMPTVGEYKDKERKKSEITEDVRDYIWKYKAHQQHNSQSYQHNHSNTYTDTQHHESQHEQVQDESRHAFSHDFTKPYTMHQIHHIHVQSPKIEEGSVINNKHISEGGYEHWRPRHPYDGFYLRHRAMFDCRGRKVCTHELPPTPPLTPAPESPPPLPVEVDTLSKGQDEYDGHSGVAGNLARVVPGAAVSQREAIDELTRRQGWEAGNIDYMGADSFDNIWAKISQTLNERSSQNMPQPKEPSPPPKQPSPLKDDVVVLKAVEPKEQDSTLTIEAKPVPEPVVQKGLSNIIVPPVEKEIIEQVTVGVSEVSLETVPACEELLKSKTTLRQDSKPTTEQASEIIQAVPAEQELPTCKIADVTTSITSSNQTAEATTESPVSNKSLNLTATSTDSPPLANTPSKEDVPSTPAAKSGERARPAHKLLLSPPIASDPLPTPDSELEDADTLAQKIIASELATPTVTSPTPPVVLSASSPPIQTEKSLIVTTPELETPPASGLVSLAQIGVKPKAKPSTAALIESSVTDKPLEATSVASKSETVPKMKVVKKVVKKESAAAAGEAPVPPPRKKEKKPKDK